jgi:Ser/Thr protein kinase RdoA (MazF antagonist)
MTPLRALKRWDANESTLQPVRESENFVYLFRNHAGNERYLRLTHSTRRLQPHVQAEVDFVNYLFAHGAAVAPPVQARSGQWVETLATDQGNFFVTAWQAVYGKKVEWGTDAHNRKVLFDRGKSLARLHQLAQGYKSAGVRRLHWVEDDLFTNPLKYLTDSETIARREYQDLVTWLLKRERTKENYGLVHGDFGSFNTLIRDDGAHVCFDFDDAVYHWYAYDIAVAIRAGRKLKFEDRKRYLQMLMEGYATEKSLGSDTVADVAQFCRLAALYRYINVIRSNDVDPMPPDEQRLLEERRKVLENPPTWY